MSKYKSPQLKWYYSEKGQKWNSSEVQKEKCRQRSKARWHQIKHLPEFKAKRLITRRRYCEKNREKIRLYMKTWRLKLMYGITVEECKELFDRNKGMCWICGSRTAEHIDHCHKTGKVRGALCHQCNVGIGYLNDDVETVLKAAQYLKTGKVVGCGLS